MELFKEFKFYLGNNIPDDDKCEFKRIELSHSYEPIIIFKAKSKICIKSLCGNKLSDNLLRQILNEYSTQSGLLDIKISSKSNYVTFHVYVNTDLIEYYSNTQILKYIHQATFYKAKDDLYEIINIKNKTLLPNADMYKISKPLKIELFDYQKRNIQRMIDIENKKEIRLKYTNEISYGDKTYIWDPLYAQVVEKDRYLKLEASGGILADEMGLGKTISTLGLIFLNNNNFPSTLNGTYHTNPIKPTHKRIYSRATLLVVPNHLAKQWINEYSKFNKEKKIVTILTKTSHSQYSYQDIKDADLVLVTQQFLMNFKYYVRLNYTSITPSIYNHSCRLQTLFNVFKKWQDENDYQTIMNFKAPLFELFHFNRLVIDEGHEIFENNLGNNSLNEFLLEWLNNVSCRYKWYVSGTPYISLMGFNTCLNFLNYKLSTDTNDYLDINKIYSNYCKGSSGLDVYTFVTKRYFMEQLLQNLIIRHRKEDVENQINIPGFTEEIQWITLTDTERKLYESKRNVTSTITLQQMCCHPLIADSLKKIFNSTDIVDLDTMQEKIIDYHKNRITIYQSKIDKLDNTTQAYHMLLANYKSVISESNFMLNILEKINQNIDIKEDTNCIICFDDVNVPVLTPCGHIYCKECITTCLKYKNECPMCKKQLKDSQLYSLDKKQDEVVKKEENPLIKKYGAKLGKLIQLIRSLIVNEENKIIVFSQWDNMLSLIGKSLAENGIENSFIKGNVHSRNSAISKFRFGLDSKGNKVNSNVIMLSLKNSASGTNLTEATHIFFVEPINQIKAECIAIEHQAIGRACRIGQKKEVKIMRLLCKDTIEEEIYNRLNPAV